MLVVIRQYDECQYNVNIILKVDMKQTLSHLDEKWTITQIIQETAYLLWKQPFSTNT